MRTSTTAVTLALTISLFFGSAALAAPQEEAAEQPVATAELLCALSTSVEAVGEGETEPASNLDLGQQYCAHGCWTNMDCWDLCPELYRATKCVFPLGSGPGECLIL